MACYILNPESITLESIILSLVSAIFIIDTLLFRVNNVTLDIGMIFTILACAYGIPALKVERVFARKYTVTAAIFATLSAILLFIITIIGINTVATGNYNLSDTDSKIVEQHPFAFNIGLSIGFVICIGVGIADGLLAAKHIKFSMALQRPINMVPEIPGKGCAYPRADAQHHEQPMPYMPSSCMPMGGPPAYEAV